MPRFRLALAVAAVATYAIGCGGGTTTVTTTVARDSGASGASGPSGAGNGTQGASAPQYIGAIAIVRANPMLCKSQYASVQEYTSVQEQKFYIRSEAEQLAQGTVTPDTYLQQYVPSGTSALQVAEAFVRVCATTGKPADAVARMKADANPTTTRADFQDCGAQGSIPGVPGPGPPLFVSGVDCSTAEQSASKGIEEAGYHMCGYQRPPNAPSTPDWNWFDWCKGDVEIAIAGE